MSLSRDSDWMRAFSEFLAIWHDNGGRVPA
jgi:hypothetical protein